MIHCPHPPYQGVGPTTTKVDKLDQPQSVNLYAPDEIKQQRPVVCPPYFPLKSMITWDSDDG